MITIRIIKLPPEAKELAKKIEQAPTSMIGRVVKSKLSVDSDLENIDITVS